MANKVYNLAGGLHSAAAYSGWENELFGGNAVASSTALKVGAGSGMTVSVGKGNALIDTGDDYSRRVALTEAVSVTLDQADTSLPRNDLIVIYVDMAVSPVQTVQDNTNGILKVVAVKGTPASSPSDPDAGTIQQAIGAGNPYMTLASIRVNAGASAISAGNITDKRPMSPNVYSTSILDLIYPIGAIAIGAKPSIGTWEQIQGRFLWASNTAHPAGNTGGSETVTLNVNQIPSHNHNFNAAYGVWGPTATNLGFAQTGGNWTGSDTAGGNYAHTANTGGTQAHENMPPYLSVDMWRRTA